MGRAATGVREQRAGLGILPGSMICRWRQTLETELASPDTCVKDVGQLDTVTVTKSED